MKDLDRWLTFLFPLGLALMSLLLKASNNATKIRRVLTKEYLKDIQTPPENSYDTTDFDKWQHLLEEENADEDDALIPEGVSVLDEVEFNQAEQQVEASMMTARHVQTVPLSQVDTSLVLERSAEWQSDAIDWELDESDDVMQVERPISQAKQRTSNKRAALKQAIIIKEILERK